jgi:uracil-DNA glycosylase family 4
VGEIKWNPPLQDTFMNDVDVKKLESLYRQIHICDRCHTILWGNIRFDPDKVQKKAFEKLLASEIFIVGQSLASNQVRLSGIPFHYPQGNRSEGGQLLEGHLNSVGYTLSPYSSRYKLAYVSDIVQCYPGRKPGGRGSGDKIPKKAEIENCQEWLLKEMSLIRPRILILLGAPATRTFFELYRINSVTKNASEYYCKPEKLKYGVSDVTICALPHPTSMVKGKRKIWERTFNIIKGKLADRVE